MPERRPRTLLVVQNLSLPFDRRPWREALSLSRAGWDVSVICPKGDGRDLESRVTLDGVAIRRYRAWEASGSALSYFVEWTHAIFVIFWLVVSSLQLRS